VGQRFGGETRSSYFRSRSPRAPNLRNSAILSLGWETRSKPCTREKARCRKGSGLTEAVEPGAEASESDAEATKLVAVAIGTASEAIAVRADDPRTWYRSPRICPETSRIVSASTSVQSKKAVQTLKVVADARTSVQKRLSRADAIAVRADDAHACRRPRRVQTGLHPCRGLSSV
jgi:hypothetical protein